MSPCHLAQQRYVSEDCRLGLIPASCRWHRLMVLKTRGEAGRASNHDHGRPCGNCLHQSSREEQTELKGATPSQRLVRRVRVCHPAAKDAQGLVKQPQQIEA